MCPKNRLHNASKRGELDVAESDKLHFSEFAFQGSLEALFLGGTCSLLPLSDIMAIFTAKKFLLLMLSLLLVSATFAAPSSTRARGKRKAVPEDDDEVILEQRQGQRPLALMPPSAPKVTGTAAQPDLPSNGEQLYGFLLQHMTLSNLTQLDQVLDVNGVYTAGAGGSTESQLNRLLCQAPVLPRLQAVGLEALGLSPEDLLQYARVLVPETAAPPPPPPKRRATRSAGPKTAPPKTNHTPTRASNTPTGALAFNGSDLGNRAAPNQGPLPGPLRDAG
jgi:hypothetical protein